MDQFVEIKRHVNEESFCLLEHKYQVKTSSDWLDNETEIETIRNFFEDDCLFLLVTGQGSTGKTTIVDLIVSENNKPVYRINFLNSHKNHEIIFKNKLTH